jgi:hypothetical protein
MPTTALLGQAIFARVIGAQSVIVVAPSEPVNMPHRRLDDSRGEEIMNEAQKGSKSESLTTAKGADEMPLVIDLGRQRRKDVKRLRKGQPGKLSEEILETIANLRAQNTIAANAHPIVVVVREKPRKRSLFR